MGTRLRDILEAARNSFWFLPAVLTVAAVGLSFGTVAIDRATAPGSHVVGWTYRGGPDGARGVLGTIAGSMITVAGVVFSTTMVALSLASSQLGPRLLRNFIRDRGNQFVLGTFVATFVYCLLVLRTVNGTEGDVFVSEVGVTAGVALAPASVAVFIHFLHHAAVSIQAFTVVARVGDEQMAAIDDLYPGGVGDGANPGEVPAAGVPQAAVTLEGEDAGYVLRLDADALVRTAAERDLVVHLAHPSGRFVRPGDALMRVASAVSASASRVADRDTVERLVAQVVRAAEGLPEPDDQARLKALGQAADHAIRDADSTDRSQT